VALPVAGCHTSTFGRFRRKNMITTFLRALRALMIVAVLFNPSRGSAESEKSAGPEMISSGIVLLDGSSSYTFSKDGRFTSAPLDMSGRTFEGTWEILEGRSRGVVKVIVKAKQGWRNGIAPGDFRRIVFFIYSGDTVPYIRPDDPEGKLARMCQNPKTYYRCYWLIDEMTEIEAPLETKE
jgi:hypothetical protein